MGERTPVALLDAAASARMAVAEAITNIAPRARRALVRHQAVRQLDGAPPATPARTRASTTPCAPSASSSAPRSASRSRSARTRCRCAPSGRARRTSAVHRAAVADRHRVRAGARRAPHADARAARERGRPRAVAGRPRRAASSRLGGSALAQVYGQLGEAPPDLDDPALLRGFFAAVQELDASTGCCSPTTTARDGGLFVTLLEMAFAGGARARHRPRRALRVDALAALFTEELGAVLQVRAADVAARREACARHGLAGACTHVGARRAGDRIAITRERRARRLDERARARCARSGRRPRMRMQRCATTPTAPTRSTQRASTPTTPACSRSTALRPRTRRRGAVHRRAARARASPILREQGVNGQIEMAAAFDRAGFEAVDVHMSDLPRRPRRPRRLPRPRRVRRLLVRRRARRRRGLGQVDPVQRARARRSSRRSSHAPTRSRSASATAARCCRALQELIPGAERWPRFVRNRSEQFEAASRWSKCSTARRCPRHGRRRLPIAVAHGEGRAVRAGAGRRRRALRRRSRRAPSTYPDNPNGSPGGITALTTTPDGRVTILMPHPERVFRTVQHSWRPARGARTAPGCASSATRGSGCREGARPECADCGLAGRRSLRRAHRRAARHRQRARLDPLPRRRRGRLAARLAAHPVCRSCRGSRRARRPFSRRWSRASARPTPRASKRSSARPITT